MDLKEEYILGDSVSEHWYYRSKAAAMLRYVHDFKLQRVLDIGAGSGYFSKELLRRTSIREALCVDTSYVSESDEVTAEKLVQYRTQCGETNVDLVLMMDVLEHVEDDVGLLRIYAD
jgi:2-polyprenyl-3-methyl-5-hydroxy-6-metoxy-1,4-benzoquinol methylase